MIIQIEGTKDEFQSLARIISSNHELSRIKDQIMNSRDLAEHDQADEVPIEGDHPFIERSE